MHFLIISNLFVASIGLKLAHLALLAFWILATVSIHNDALLSVSVLPLLIKQKFSAGFEADDAFMAILYRIVLSFCVMIWSCVGEPCNWGN